LCVGIRPAFAVIGIGSRALGEGDQIEIELRVLFRRMSVENLLWGATRPAKL
jgi:hypothetical protein